MSHWGLGAYWTSVIWVQSSKLSTVDKHLILLWKFHTDSFGQQKRNIWDLSFLGNKWLGCSVITSSRLSATWPGYWSPFKALQHMTMAKMLQFTVATSTIQKHKCLSPWLPWGLEVDSCITCLTKTLDWNTFQVLQESTRDYGNGLLCHSCRKSWSSSKQYTWVNYMKEGSIQNSHKNTQELTWKEIRKVCQEKVVLLQW